MAQLSALTWHLCYLVTAFCWTVTTVARHESHVLQRCICLCTSSSCLDSNNISEARSTCYQQLKAAVMNLGGFGATGAGHLRSLGINLRQRPPEGHVSVLQAVSPLALQPLSADEQHHSDCIVVCLTGPRIAAVYAYPCPRKTGYCIGAFNERLESGHHCMNRARTQRGANASTLTDTSTVSRSDPGRDAFKPRINFGF